MNTAEIVNYSRARDGHIEYRIKVVHNGRVWQIRKRFRQFAQLHSFLTKEAAASAAQEARRTAAINRTKSTDNSSLVNGNNAANSSTVGVLTGLTTGSGSCSASVGSGYTSCASFSSGGGSMSATPSGGNGHTTVSAGLASHNIVSNITFPYPPTSLPKKSRPWKRIDERLLRMRWVGLQKYLDDLLRTYSIAECSLLREFFEVEGSWLEYAKKQGAQKLRCADRLSNLPLEFLSMMIPMQPVPLANHLSNSKYWNSSHGRSRTGSVVSSFSGSSFASRASISTTTRTASMARSISKVGLARSTSFLYGSPDGNHSPNGSGSPLNTQTDTANSISCIQDRRTSMDVYFGSAHSIYPTSSNISVAGTMPTVLPCDLVASTVKRTPFCKAVEKLWPHYQADIYALLAVVDEVYYNVDSESNDEPVYGGGLSCNASPMVLSRNWDAEKEELMLTVNGSLGLNDTLDDMDDDLPFITMSPDICDPSDLVDISHFKHLMHPSSITRAAKVTLDQLTTLSSSLSHLKEAEIMESRMTAIGSHDRLIYQSLLGDYDSDCASYLDSTPSVGYAAHIGSARRDDSGVGTSHTASVMLGTNGSSWMESVAEADDEDDDQEDDNIFVGKGLVRSETVLHSHS